MAPNIIGSTFLLAETSISDNNNNNKTAATATTTATAAKQQQQSQQPNNNNKNMTSNNNSRVPSQGEPASLVKSNNNTETNTKSDTATKKPFKADIVYHNVLAFIVLHASAFYGLYLVFAEKAYFEMAIGEYIKKNLSNFIKSLLTLYGTVFIHHAVLC